MTMLKLVSLASLVASIVVVGSVTAEDATLSFATFSSRSNVTTTAGSGSANSKETAPEEEGIVKKMKHPDPRAVALLNKMTLPEKAAILVGKPSFIPYECTGYIIPNVRLGLPNFCFRDGGSGVHMSIEGLPINDKVSAFPNPIALAATWDKDLVRRASEAMAEEFRQKGTHILNGPVTGGPYGRSAFDGRVFENYGADPVLCGELGYQAVQGIQSTGVQATAKHFIAYEQETMRDMSGFYTGKLSHQEPIDSIVDNRATHEIYLWGFAEAIRAGTSAIMCSYNRVNGSHACESVDLHHLLKHELNFEGFVVSDSFATWSSAKALQNGMDMNMPGDVWIGSLIKDRILNEVSPARVNDAVLRILTPYFKLNQAKRIPQAYSIESINQDAAAGHETVIREAANAAATLLKNVGGALPLPKHAKLAVFGDDAGRPDGLLADATHHADCGFAQTCTTESTNGTAYTGGGSGSAVSTKIRFPLQALEAHVKHTKVGRMRYNLNNNLWHEPAQIRETLRGADTAVVFIALRGAEGKDLPNLRAENHGDALVEAVARHSSNVIVVIHTTNPIVIYRWINNPNVTAVINAYSPGGEVGPSIVDVLYGKVNPSGKLPYTMAKNEKDYIAPVTKPSKDPKSHFRESLLLDYRRFDKRGIVPQFPFGFGLSYTTFTYPSITVTNNLTAGAEAHSSDPHLYYTAATVEVTVTNTGSMKGSEVVQVYLKYPEDAGEPPKVLRGFDKVHDIAPGQTKTATITMPQKYFSIWDVAKQLWVVPSGQYTVYAAASSRDLRQSYSITLG